jgi:hypothetical protein
MPIPPRILGGRLYILLVLASTCLNVRSQDINTGLMNSTFEILGPSATHPGATTFGTIFIMGKPLKDDATKSYYVLTTAAHVLNEISGDEATLRLRKKNKEGTFDVVPSPIKIRQNGANLFKVNPEADVAVMYVALKTEFDVSPIPIQLLADDAALEQLQVHPGDELLCLRFPLAAELNGFPVVRSGLLASYPVTPYKTVKNYFYNFHVFPGNSGGPVYFVFSNRIYGGATHIGISQGVIGLVSEQLSSAFPEYKDASLDIAKVVPSSFIRDTIALLPDAP